MFKIKNEFDRICVLADVANKKLNFKRFHTMSATKQKYAQFGIYDSVDKKFVLFDTIYFAGHYGYDKHVKPQEFVEMEKLIENV
jgi:hypothetical protein